VPFGAGGVVAFAPAEAMSVAEGFLPLTAGACGTTAILLSVGRGAAGAAGSWPRTFSCAPFTVLRVAVAALATLVSAALTVLFTRFAAMSCACPT